VDVAAVNVPRLVAAVAVVWACLLSAATGATVWENTQRASERDARICESLDRFAVFLGHEFELDDEELDDARARLAVELEC
jgi:hypothetical protein